jgi:uncharacterized protein YjbJ (UPF0337 family)
MNEGTKDKFEGTAHELKGKVKETVGHATGDQDMEDEGTAEKVGGKVENKVGDVERAVKH